MGPGTLDKLIVRASPGGGPVSTPGDGPVGTPGGGLVGTPGGGPVGTPGGALFCCDITTLCLFLYYL